MALMPDNEPTDHDPRDCHTEIDALRAEAKALSNQIAVTNVELADTMRERDALRAERDKFKQAFLEGSDKVVELREECRLAAELQIRTGTLADQYEAEIERLKEQHEIDNGVQEKLYVERDEALHQAERLAHENERLQRESHFKHETALQMHDRQVALLEQRDQEIERLRAALSEIVERPSHSRRIAHAALSQS